MRRTQAFILAGGQGERLHPLTVSRPKPAVSFGGMFRIIDFTLFNCLHSGLSRVSLLTQYKHETLHQYVRQGWRDLWNGAVSNREPLSCVPPVRGKRYRGTAEAVFQNEKLLHDDCENVLVLSGDHIYQMDYRDLLRQHLDTNADLTIATVEHPLRQSSRFGVVEVDDNLKVIGFQEKPSNPQPLPGNPAMALVSMGIYIFRKSILLESLRSICDSQPAADFGRDVIPALILSGRTYAFDFRDKTTDAPRYWRDIGTIDAYHSASMDLLGADRPLVQYASGPTQTRKTAPRLHGSSRLTRTVVSAGVQVGHSAILEESVLMPGVRVGKGARLRGVIVEEGVHIPAGFRAGFDPEDDRTQHTVTDSGIVVISKTPRATRPTLVIGFGTGRARNLIAGDAEPLRATA